MKKMITVLFLMMVLTACANATDKENLEATKKDSTKKTEHHYQFTGESEHWEAVYSYKATQLWGRENGQITYSSKDNYVLTLKYKGSLKELSSMKKLEYSYETTASSGSKTEDYPDPPRENSFKTSGGSKNGALVGKGEVIKVNVKWADNDESFELRNKAK
ncbi:hypothetical protein [Peribacillus muralis]|uniref:hypothetical protein n=1 Tax=Peribacillus muralis TaxID=264697 RepID=UPI0009F553F8|nr:hypothetical protein [Peribacillus muralis]